MGLRTTLSLKTFSLAMISKIGLIHNRLNLLVVKLFLTCVYCFNKIMKNIGTAKRKF